jgi:hypothetical protein
MFADELGRVVSKIRLTPCVAATYALSASAMSMNS